MYSSISVKQVCTLIFYSIWLLGACTRLPEETGLPAPEITSAFNIPTQITDASTPNATLPPTTTPLPPTSTPIPLALSVNDEGVSLEAFVAAVNRLQSVQETPLPADQAIQQIQEDFINQLLLSQSAIKDGYTISEDELDDRINSLEEKVGGVDALMIWQTENFYTPEIFRSDLRLAVSAAWMRDQITNSIPDFAEQVHARQILLYNFDEAQNVLQQLQSGTSFDILASIYEPNRLGDLGWFPRGYLFSPEIEEVAFTLEPGNISNIIETELGFHIIQVLERVSERPLDPDAKLVLQEKYLEQWLMEKRLESKITFFTP